MNAATAISTMPDGDEQEPAALEDPRDRRVEDDDEGERGAERRERPDSRPAQEPEDLDRGEGRDERDGGGEDGAAEGEDDEQDGHEHRGTDRSLTHRPLVRPSAPEAALTAGELEQRGVERVRAEVRPQRVAEVELGVGGLPDQEVGQALLAAGPDDEVRVGQAGRVQGRADRALVDLVGRDAARGESPERVDELGPAGVVEGDVEQQPLAAGGRVERLADRRPGRVGQLVEPAEQPDPDALRREARRSRSGWPPRAARTAR